MERTSAGSPPARPAPLLAWRELDPCLVAPTIARQTRPSRTFTLSNPSGCASTTRRFAHRQVPPILVVILTIWCSAFGSAPPAASHRQLRLIPMRTRGCLGAGLWRLLNFVPERGDD